MKKFDLLTSLNHVDERLVDRAAQSMQGKPKLSKPALFGRIGAIAAGLAVVIALGAMTAPLLGSNNPTDTEAGNHVLQGSQVQTDEEKSPASPSLLHIVPLSQVDTADGEQGDTQQNSGVVGTFTQESFWRDSYAVLTFDASLGTDVTLNTFWENLYIGDLPELAVREEVEGESGAVDKATKKLMASFHRPMRGRGQLTATVNINEQYVVWGYDVEVAYGNNRTLNNHLARMENAKEMYGEDSTYYQVYKERFDEYYASRWGDTFGGLILDSNEDMLIYTIRNDNGDITVMGAIYANHKHLIDNVDHIYYDDAVITRYADLGCVRFDIPVTEEEAQAQLVALFENLPEVKASMDFTPTNANENYMAGLADLLANYPFNPPAYDHYSTSGFSHSGADNFCTFHVGWVPKDEEVIDASHANHVFYIYDDGTWEEVTDKVLVEEESQELLEIPE